MPNRVSFQSPEATALYERIDAIVPLIPDTFYAKDKVVEVLREKQSLIQFYPTILMPCVWGEVAAIIGGTIPDKDEENWAAEIFKILQTPLPVSA